LIPPTNLRSHLGKTEPVLVKAGIAEWAFDGFDKSELDEISKLGTFEISQELFKRANRL
jgi:hypothetical protein